MGVKFARSFGTQVVVFTSSAKKAQDAVRLGAYDVVGSHDEAAMKTHLNSFDFILDTVSAPHDLNAYLALLKRDGVMVRVGLPETPLVLEASNLVFGRRQLAGSLIGGLPETQEMLDYCLEQRIASDVEVIPIQKINEAYQRMITGDVTYRFVIDLELLSH